MERWQSSVDRQIQKAIEEGQMSKLAGEGKPLLLNDDPNTPEELRMAYKILRDNQLAPDWIMQGQELERARIEAIETLQHAANTYRRSPVQRHASTT